MTPRRILQASVFIWCAAIVATPIMASSDSIAAKAASLSYQFFSHVCHQLDSHSFHIAGYKFAVCIRCASIYASFFLGLFYFPNTKQAKILNGRSARVLIFSLIPMGIDVALAAFRIHESTVMTRCITGLIFGLALSIVLAPVLEELARKLLSYTPALPEIVEQPNLRNLQSALNLRNPSNQSRLDNATKTR